MKSFWSGFKYKINEAVDGRRNKSEANVQRGRRPNGLEDDVDNNKGEVGCRDMEQLACIIIIFHIH